MTRLRFGWPGALVLVILLSGCGGSARQGSLAVAGGTATPAAVAKRSPSDSFSPDGKPSERVASEPDLRVRESDFQVPTLPSAQAPELSLAVVPSLTSGGQIVVRASQLFTEQSREQVVAFYRQRCPELVEHQLPNECYLLPPGMKLEDIPESGERVVISDAHGRTRVRIETFRPAEGL